MFKTNEGTTDRVVRVILGITLISLALAKGWLWGWIGVVPLLTGAFGFCGLYTVFGINTCRTK